MYRVRKRDGELVDFNISKISNAITKAFEATGTEYNESVIDFLSIKVTADFQGKIEDGAVSVEDIQDSVEAVLSRGGYEHVAKAYILYRRQREKLRNMRSTYLDYKNVVDSYLDASDWRVKENSTVNYSVGGLILSNSGAITANYWLSEIYDDEIANAHKNADLHLHDLSMLTGYCAGWSLKQLIQEGLGGIPGKITSSPASHLSTLCNQMVNFLGIMQNEWAGAQAFSSFDTYLAPFVKVDNLNYKEVKQCIQSFVYGVNTPSRWGTQAPFSNITLDWTVPKDLENLPAIVGGNEQSESVWHVLAVTTLKLGALVVFALVVGQRIIPKLLAYVARTGTRDLFTLSVLVLALGVAVGAANFFGASMALGAFLSGMVVGQSEFSSQAAAEALPMRDAFAVLFFVSVGMLFNPASLISDWPLILATLGIVLIGKPLAAFIVVKLFGKPLRMALSVAVALAQIGEFSFILAAMGVSFGVLPKEASSAIIVTAIVSITLNPLLYRRINGAAHWLESKGIGLPRLDENELSHPEGAQRIIVVGYGPVGKQLTGILRDNNLDVVVVEMNIDTVRQVSALGEKIIYGDATQREVLLHAGAEEAEGLIISSSSAPAGEIVEVARAINPNLRILVHTTYLRVAENLKSEGVSAVFPGEREVAVAMTEHLMRDFGATDEQIDRERRKLRERMA